MQNLDLDPARLDDLERRIRRHRGTRIPQAELWKLFAAAFPNRPPGEERTWFLQALQALEARDSLTLPSQTGKRWDRSQRPPVPTSVDVKHPPQLPADEAWRSHAWHPSLAWIHDLKTLTPRQNEFLKALNAAIIDGTIKERVPRKYRSLQLTRTEKELDQLLSSSLFGPNRLNPALLNFDDEILPMACHVTGPRGRVLIFENAGPFHVARTVLAAVPDPPYDVVAFGGGNSVAQSMSFLTTLGRTIERIEYVGDLDYEGRKMARTAAQAAQKAKLPPVQPSETLHALMLKQRAAFQHPDGWDHHPSPRTPLEPLLRTVHDQHQADVQGLLAQGRRVPEEVLGPRELRQLWGER